MDIRLEGVGKRFNQEWIFRHLNLSIPKGTMLSVQGYNGSGKSTFLKLLLGYVVPSEGIITYSEEEKSYIRIGFASPYLELFTDLTLLETIIFNGSFKGFVDGFDAERVLEITGFSKIGDRLLRNLSSGMLQRVKLAMAIFSNVEVILLDEPCSNLDKNGIKWYQNLINQYGNGRTVVVCSNQQEDEYSFCSQTINILDFKS